MRRSRTWTAVVVAGLLTGGAPVTAQIVETAPPPGFDDLDGPRPAVVDVFFDGAEVGMADAIVRPGFIRFDDPAGVAELLPGAVDTAAVAAALADELPANTDRVCGPRPEPECGVLEPSIAGVIFDIDSFRVDVFVAVAYRELRSGSAMFVPPPAWTPSALQDVGVAASFITDDDDSSAVVSGRSIAAVGPARTIGTYGFDKDVGYFTDTLLAQYDRRGWRLEGGLDRALPVPILGERRFLGARLGTTLDTRLDRRSVRGSPLVVILPRRSQVEVLRDGRLLTAQSLPAGTQAIDTTNLPTGSYDVTLRIISATGVREEERFFVKSDALPPADAPQGLIEAGVFADDEQADWPEVGSVPFIHGALRYRLLDNLGVGADAALNADEVVVSAQGFWLWRNLELAADGFAADDGAYGAALAARGTFDRFNFLSSVRRSFGEREAGSFDLGDIDDPDDDQFIPDDALDSITAFADATTQVDLSLSYRFDDGPTIGLRGFWRDTVDTDPTFSVGPNLSWPLARWNNTHLDLFVDAATTEDESFALARLRLSFGVGGWRAQAAGGYRWSSERDGDDGISAGASLTRDWEFDDARLQTTGRLDHEASATTIGGDAAVRSRAGSLGVALDHEIEDGQSRLALNGRTTLVASGAGVGVGGRDVQDSALMVVTDGTGDGVFDVLVDERSVGTIRAGDKLVVPVRTYDAYRVRLRQTEGGVVAYDGSTRALSLYPGTVAAERWQVSPLVTVFGRVVAADGAPLADATLMTEPRFYTDGDGYFQADLAAGRPEVDVVGGDGRCRLDLPELVPADTYQRLGDIRCSNGEGSSSPR